MGDTMNSESVFDSMVRVMVRGYDKVPESVVNDPSGIRYRDNKPVNQKKVAKKQHEDIDEIL